VPEEALFGTTARGTDRRAPIGVFDSGLGGLTVVRAIRARAPSEDLVYLGDTARVPYGTRSAKTVLQYARACARRLREDDIKLLVVACNTVSAVALDLLAVELDIPVLGVVGPGARAGVRATRAGRIGVLATAGTIDSGAYPRAIAGSDSRAETFTQAAPLLVPLAEEGWTDGELPALAARRYLAPLVASRIDTLVLGCTHYPLLADVIGRELDALAGRHVPVVDSAEATAEELTTLLAARDLVTDRVGDGTLRILVTDVPRRFTEVAARFLGQELSGLDVEAIDL
jgi:glutamate racemase